MIYSNLHPQPQNSSHMAGTGILRIDCNHIAENYAYLQSISPSARVSAVVKANAYGLGAEEVVKALQVKGCTLFFVATCEEGISLRKCFPDIEIAILNGIWTGPLEDFIHFKLCPVLNNLYDVTVWRNLAKDRGCTLSAILHVNTGMNRLGMPRSEVDNVTTNLEQAFLGLDIQYVMSHFCSSEDNDDPENMAQYTRFCELTGLFPHMKYSLANSSGIFRDPQYHFDLVRPGMALYGLNPTPEEVNPMKPVISLEVPVLQVHEARAGESIGYNCTYQLSKNEQVATVCLGYADGLLRTLSNQGALYWNGKKCPILGRVSMDLITVSLQNVQGECPKPGDMMEVIGKHQSADDLAKSAGTIGYEVLTSLSTRYRRVYISS